MSGRHACAGMPRGIALVEGAGGWHVRFERAGSELAREVTHCPWCGRRLGAPREGADEKRRRGGMRRASPACCVEYGYEWDFVRPSDPKYRPDKSEPPAPNVLDADGAEIRERRDVWRICEGDERGVHAERLRVETILPDGLVECSPHNGGTWVHLEPSELYVNEPVPAADRRPSVVSDGYVVRRLTPRECERLMGFPDDWTKVPYRGKPAEECPDTPRYKAIGNSMAVNVMRWLGVRIDAVDEGENPDEACSRLRGQIFGV